MRRNGGLRIGNDIGGPSTALVFLKPRGRLDNVKVPAPACKYPRAVSHGTTTARLMSEAAATVAPHRANDA